MWAQRYKKSKKSHTIVNKNYQQAPKSHDRQFLSDASNGLTKAN